LAGYQPSGEPDALWAGADPPSLVIDEVERIWTAIAESDDWEPLWRHLAAIRRLGSALGRPPTPAGHATGVLTA